ncbi:MAG: 3'(2'),5'-bisphosphate nucleotidase CysQ [Alphaproteobacteria bacterium]
MTLAQRLVQPVRDTGKEIMHIHAAGVVADTKADGSPVTMADEAAEAILLHALREMAPDIAVISEENAESHRLAPPDRFFLVDPLDGTKEFLRPDGQGAFTVNIGLVEMGVPVMGIVYAPALDRLFYGVVGQGATEMSAGNVRDIGVRPVPASGAIAVASRSHRDAATNQWLETHGINDTIATGSSLKFCLVAAGEADVYPRFGPTMEWDTAAGDAVLRAAGGRVIHPEGMPFTYGKTEYRNGGFVACGAFVPNAVG